MWPRRLGGRRAARAGRPTGPSDRRAAGPMSTIAVTLPLDQVRIANHADESGELAAALLADLGAEVRRDTPIDDALDAVILTGTPRTLRERDLEPNRLLARHRRLIVALI